MTDKPLPRIAPPFDLISFFPSDDFEEFFLLGLAYSIPISSVEQHINEIVYDENNHLILKERDLQAEQSRNRIRITRQAAAYAMEQLWRLGFRPQISNLITELLAGAVRIEQKALPAIDDQERKEVVRTLRDICQKYGDNDWMDNLHLVDILRKHLQPYLEKHPIKPLVISPAILTNFIQDSFQGFIEQGLVSPKWSATDTLRLGERLHKLIEEHNE